VLPPVRDSMRKGRASRNQRDFQGLGARA
jgi:hypothetical protein